MILRALNITFLLIILSFFYQKANTENFYNWDAVAYTMAVQLDEGKSVDEAHTYTYKTLKDETYSEEKKLLTSRYYSNIKR